MTVTQRLVGGMFGPSSARLDNCLATEYGLEVQELENDLERLECLRAAAAARLRTVAVARRAVMA